MSPQMIGAISASVTQPVPTELSALNEPRRPGGRLGPTAGVATDYQVPPALQAPAPTGEHENDSVPFVLLSVNGSVSVGDMAEIE